MVVKIIYVLQQTEQSTHCWLTFFIEREISSLYNARFLRDGEAFESV